MGLLYNSLVNRGYLKGHRSTGFRLTAIGGEAIQAFIRHNGTEHLDIVERLRILGITISPEQERKILEIEEESITSEPGIRE